MSELPKGWLVADIGDLCLKVTDGSHNPPKASEEGLPMLSAKNIHDGLVDFNERHRLIPVDQFDIEDKRTRIEEGDILLTIVGTLGRSAVVSSTAVKFTLQRSVAVLSAPQLNPYAFRYFLESHGFQKQLEEQAKGTAQKGVYLKALKQLTILVPPLAEQKRIVEKLDQVLAQVDTIKARLDGIPAILKRFRQSVLAAAVSGKLTEDWRTLHALTGSWKKKLFVDICREITVGFVGKMSDKYTESGVPFLRSQNVRAFRFSSDNLLYISKEFHNEIYKSRLEPGDLAIVRSGAPGTTCVVPKVLEIANCSDLVIARPNLELNSEFGCIFMNSEIAQKNVSENQVGIAQQHFNVGSMKKMPINLPTLTEQTEIVRLVDQYFAFADTIEKQVQKAQQRVDKLTKSILAKAFRGELVPQDPTDEPADQLLKRIAAARAESEALAKAAKKTTKKVGKKIAEKTAKTLQ